MMNFINSYGSNPFFQLLLSIVFGSVFMSIVFIYAQLKERYDIVDSAWGMTFLYIALMQFYVSTGGRHGGEEINTTRILVLTLVAVWAIRISFHIFKRFMRSDEQDPRYTEIIDRWHGNTKVQAYLRIFILQAALASIIVWPAVMIFNGALFKVNLLVAIGVIVWLIGFISESIADKQLQEFVKIKANKGKLLKTGLWKYSRHPNYFGEIMQWWGIAIIALNVHYGYVGLIGPLVLTYLIVSVSGLPPAERRSAKKPGWKQYKENTSPLIPWYPTKS